MRIQCFVLLLYLSIVLCQLKRNGKCTGTSFRCSNGQCIPSTSVCDGAVDCSDRSDETQAVCTELSLSCPSFAFRCAYGACVDKITKCNGVQDCADNSDELLPECVKPNQLNKANSLCKKYEFECNSGQCIDATSTCDGTSDCFDGSDETITQCIDIGCPGYSFQCAYGGCIDKKKKCNDVEDCKDGSDEDIELCKNYTKFSGTTQKPMVNTPTRRKPVIISGGCPLPEKPKGGDYEVSDCEEGTFSDKCRKVPGTIVQPNVILTYSCGPGYILPENVEHSFCKDGHWSPKFPQCQKVCKGLQSDSVELKCFYRGAEVDCSKPVRPGTKLEAKCKNAYHLTDHSAAFTVTECLQDGTWASDLFKCFPDCGKRNRINQVKPTIKGGSKTNQSEYPWHVAIYRNNNGVMECICGGTIIHPKAVLTAAHCVYNDTVQKPSDKKLLRVAVGKYRSNWDHRDSSEDQRFRVIEIIIQSAYLGRNNRYEQDIAILDLDKLIILSNGVMPVCFDRHDSLSLYKDPKAVGTVVGWGITDNNRASDVLLVARLSYYDFRNCHTKFGSNGFSDFITYDKFCAGLDNGTSVQEGDSGGALTFPRQVGDTEQHFIYGIVSLKPLKSDKIAAFTNVSLHMEWIDKVLIAIKFKKPNL